MSDAAREVLDRDAAELQVFVPVERSRKQRSDPDASDLAEDALEAARPVVLEAREPGEERFGRAEIRSAQRLLHREAQRVRVGQGGGRRSRRSDRHAGKLEDLAGPIHATYRSSVTTGPLDRTQIEAIVAAVAERLEGRWLLVVGSLVALELEPGRTTEDVDLVGLEGTQAERFALMDLACDLGLPIEAVNSAADFFVRRIAGWERELSILRAGPRATVYRPTPTLFVLLKVGRLSERDLEDCELALSRAEEEGSPLDRLRIVAALDALAPTEDAALTARRLRLRLRLSPPERA